MSAHRTSEDPPSTPVPPGKPLISLLLTLHLGIVALALSTNLTASLLQQALRGLCAPYTQLLNIDLDFTPYHLTHATEADVDHRLEILPAGSDPEGRDWIVLPDVGWRGGERYRRYQRLAESLALRATTEDPEVSSIAAAVATHYLNREHLEPGRLRVQRHMLQSPEAVASGSEAERDPNHPAYFDRAYDAHVVVDGDQVSVVPIPVRSDAAQPVVASQDSP